MQKFSEEKIILNEELYCVDEAHLKDLLHRSIGSLTFLNIFKKRAVGSGAVISPNLILTAAHNIYDKKFKCQHTDFKFYLGADGEAKKYFQVESWRYLEQFKTCSINSRIECDYALIKLKRPVSLNQFLPLSLVCEHCLMQNQQISLQIFGFPDACGGNYDCLDKNGQRFKLSQFGQSRKKRIISVQPQKFAIAYAISTLPGQSGSPVCMDNKIIAIHNGGGKLAEQFNVGRLITPDLLDRLDIWRQQLNSIKFSTITTRFCPQTTRNEVNMNVQGQNAEISKLKLSLQVSLNKNKYLQDILKDRQIDIIQKDKKISELESLLKLFKLGGHIKPQEVKQLSKKELQANSDQIPQQIRQIVQDSMQDEDLTLFERDIPAIDVTKLTNLKTLTLYKNQLTKINLSQNFKLIQLDLSNNKILKIDLKNNKNLRNIDLSYNNLTQIDLSIQKNIRKLRLQSNQLITINLSNQKKLDEVNLQQNCLKSIIMWFSQENELIQVSNQKSEQCKVNVLCRKQEKKKVMKVLREIDLQFIDDIETYNQHQCDYTFESIEKN